METTDTDRIETILAQLNELLKDAEKARDDLKDRQAEEGDKYRYWLHCTRYLGAAILNLKTAYYGPHPAQPESLT